MNTNFVHGNILRLLKKDIDFTQNVEIPDNMYVDLIFADEESERDQNKKSTNVPQQNKNDNFDLDYAVRDCIKYFSP